MMPLISKGTHVGISKSALHFTTNQKKKNIFGLFWPKFCFRTAVLQVTFLGYLTGLVLVVRWRCWFWSFNNEAFSVLFVFLLYHYRIYFRTKIQTSIPTEMVWSSFWQKKSLRSGAATHFFLPLFWRLLALKVVSHLYPSSSKFFERGKIWMTMLEWASPWNACQIQPSFVYLIVSILRRAIQRVRFPPTTLAFRGSTNISGNDNWAKNSNRE